MLALCLELGVLRNVVQPREGGGQGLWPGFGAWGELPFALKAQLLVSPWAGKKGGEEGRLCTLCDLGEP